MTLPKVVERHYGQMGQVDMKSNWRDVPFTEDQNRFTYQFSAGVVLVLLGVWIGSLLFASDEGYGTNLYTEMLSIAVTIFILDLRADWREKRRRERELKERLVREAGSTINDTAKSAVNELRKREWLSGEGGVLYRVDWRRANLQRVRLNGAMMSRADLSEANLQGTNLQDADLSYANLGGANLRAANLHGADLNGAVLAYRDDGGEVVMAQFDRDTILPDGSTWREGVNMAGFGAVTAVEQDS